ncbi:hypothetical protein EV182_008578, partial [Spiromyces aspiralis]
RLGNCDDINNSNVAATFVSNAKGGSAPAPTTPAKFKGRLRNPNYAGTPSGPAARNQDNNSGSNDMHHSPSRLSLASTNSVGTMATAAGMRGAAVGRYAGAIWAISFSQCGRYFAAGGQDGVVRIWRLKAFAREEQRKQETRQDDSNASAGVTGDATRAKRRNKSHTTATNATA